MKRKTPNQYLDQHTQHLAKKHHQRLQTMTFQALDILPKKKSSVWIKPTLASALTLAIIASTFFLQDTEKRTTEIPTTVAVTLPVLPEWVLDTKTPDTLIENLDFYDWLAQQTENQSPVDEKNVTLAVNQSYWLRFGKRLPSRNLAQRLPRTTFYPRGIQ